MRIRNILVSAVCVTMLAYNFYNALLLDKFADIVEIGVVSQTAKEEQKKDKKTMASVAEDVLERFPEEDKYLKLSGLFLRTTGIRSYYNNSYGLNISTNGYCVGKYDQTSTNYEVQQMKDFQKYLDEKDIDLLYVSEPAKYIDDAFYTQQFGGASYLNRNADLFLKRIKKEGINYIDLRDNIREENIDSFSQFYRTDHHWTVPASKWAAQKVAEKLNNDYGYQIDTTLYEDVHYAVEPYPNSWIGEQGQKINESYMGRDDFYLLYPTYPTSYTVYGDNNEVVKEGDFGIFVNRSIIDNQAKTYNSKSWHYIYTPPGYQRIHNNLVQGGKVLIIGDSYQATMAPFLSLGFEETTIITPREMDITPREFIEKGDYDLVIVAYTQFMIGAHDDRKNANYKSFTFQ